MAERVGEAMNFEEAQVITSFGEVTSRGTGLSPSRSVRTAASMRLFSKANVISAETVLKKGDSIVLDGEEIDDISCRRPISFNQSTGDWYIRISRDYYKNGNQKKEEIIASCTFKDGKIIAETVINNGYIVPRVEM